MIEGLLALALAVAVPVGLRHAAGVVGAGPVDGTTEPIAGALVAAIVALALPRGPWAAALAVPWLATTVAIGAAAIVRPGRAFAVGPLMPLVVRGPAPDRSVAVLSLGIVVALGFLAVGAASLVLDRAAIRPFGFATTIVLLTAVHFHVAGFVLTLAGALVARARPGAASRLALGTLVVGTPLTALGFFGFPLVNWVGALLVAAAGLTIGLAEVGLARAGDASPSRRLIGVGGATLLVTMPLAAGYATGSAFGIALLDIPAMAAIHGTLNILGFAIPSMVGWNGVGR